MAKVIGLPKLSPTMDEGTLVRWVKGEGDAVEIDDLLAEVETDKATMEFRSFDKGVLLKILVPEGETLAPDTPVAIIGKKGENIDGLDASGGGAGSAGKVPETAKKASSDKPDDEGVSEGKGKAEAKETSKADAAEQASSKGAPGSSATTASPESGRIFASPLVRKIAREEGIALQEVSGSGPGGRIIKRDVEGLKSGDASAERSKGSSSGTSPTMATPVSDRPASKVEKLSSMRKTIARRLTESKQTIPHFYLTVDVDAAPLWDLRQTINREMVPEGEKVSVNDLIIKASAAALVKNPQANASFMGDTVHLHQRVDISVAVAIPDGLVTPVIRDADRIGALEISRQVKVLAQKAKDKKLSVEEMSNGTFSVSNLGMYGIDGFDAVINPPEGAILAVGAIRDEPVVQAGAVVPGKRMKMTLSCDHRVIDGAVAAKFLSDLRAFIERPMSMIV